MKRQDDQKSKLDPIRIGLNSTELEIGPNDRDHKACAQVHVHELYVMMVKCLPAPSA